MEFVRRYSGETIDALLCLLILSSSFLYSCHTQTHTAPIARAASSAIVASVERANAFPNLKTIEMKSNYSIDAIEQRGRIMTVAGANSRTSTVERGQPIVFVGWAVDSVTKSDAAGVYIVVDGKRRFAAVYGSARPDVGASLAMPDAADCGFAVAIPEMSLSPGVHSVGIDIINSEISEIFRQSTPISLNVSG